MNTQLAVHVTIGGVPVLLVGDWSGGKRDDAEYVAVVDCRGIDLERFLGELLPSFNVPPGKVAFPEEIRPETLRVALNGKTGWLSVSLESHDFELFLIRQMKDASKPGAVGLRASRPILLRELPWLDQYAAEFPELSLGIQNLGFLYATDPGSYPFPCTSVAPAGTGAAEKFIVDKGGFYAWITQDIIPLEQTLWIPPLKPDKLPGSDQAKTETGEAANVDKAKLQAGEASQAGPSFPARGDMGTASDGSTAGESKISWLNVNKTLGPFTLAKVGGSYADNKVTILLNASVSAAGLTLRLYGLGLRSPIYPIKPEFMLSGMGLSYARGPVELSGGLATPDMGKSFFGEVLVRTKGFGLSAIGAYYNNPDYKSLFVFGMLDLPLGGPPAFFVTGLAAGFGYNSKLILPPVSKLNEFVLVNGALPAGPDNPFTRDQGKNNLQKLMDSRDNIQPVQGESWMAAGVRFTSFEMIQSFALITVSFGTRCEIALLGRSQMSIPPRLPGGADEPYTLAFAEIDLEAVIDPGATDLKPVLAVNGIVAAGSYVFAKGCRLTGGFAFYVWASGEFVVTFGGYHPCFKPPAYYPSVGRLGFVWQVSGNLYTQGELYLTLTGSGIMAGFVMQAVYQSGPVVASFLARADFLLSWKPFYYDVSISVQIRIALHFNLGLLTTNLSYQVGVDIHLFGPPFGGVARVNLDVISFSIPFGSETPVLPEPLKWDEFATTFLPPDNTVPASNGARPALVQWAGVTGGLIRETKERVWIINPRDLEITTHSGIPATEAYICAEGNWDSEEPCDPPMTGTPVGILPMKVDSIKSVHWITLLKRGEDGDWNPCKGLLEFDPVRGKSPNALYGNAALPGSVDPLSPENAMIDKTLLGIKITPARQEPAHTQAQEINEILSDDRPPVTYQGFINLSPSTDHTQCHAPNPDLTPEPELGLLTALGKAGCAVVA